MTISALRVSWFLLIAFFSVVGAFLFPAPAVATLIDIQSNNAQNKGDGLGTFTGSLDYEYSNSTSATLTVVLKNTSSTTNPSGWHYLTGFVFNNPNSSDIKKVTKYTASTNGKDFTEITSKNGLKGQPWGYFNFGAALGGKWEGGGSPNNGLAPGTSATFTFTFSGSKLNQLTTKDFVNALSTGGGGGKEFFAVRFKGGTASQSDKEPGEGVNHPFVASPEPSSFMLGALLGSSLLGFWGIPQRRKMSAAVA